MSAREVRRALVRTRLKYDGFDIVERFLIAYQSIPDSKPHFSAADIAATVFAEFRQTPNWQATRASDFVGALLKAKLLERPDNPTYLPDDQERAHFDTGKCFVVQWTPSALQAAAQWNAEQVRKLDGHARRLERRPAVLRGRSTTCAQAWIAWYGYTPFRLHDLPAPLADISAEEIRAVARDLSRECAAKCSDYDDNDLIVREHPLYGKKLYWRLKARQDERG